MSTFTGLPAEIKAKIFSQTPKLLAISQRLSKDIKQAVRTYSIRELCELPISRKELIYYILTLPTRFYINLEGNVYRIHRIILYPETTYDYTAFIFSLTKDRINLLESYSLHTMHFNPEIFDPYDLAGEQAYPDVDLLTAYRIISSRTQCSKSIAKELVLNALEKIYRNNYVNNIVNLISLYSTLYCNCVVMGLDSIERTLINIEKDDVTNPSKYEKDRQFLIKHIDIDYKRVRGFLELL